jgi:hypothetical protein
MRMQTIAVFLGWIALAGCAGDGDGLDENGRPIGEDPGGGGGGPAADFASIQASVFTPICTVCHTGASAPLGLRLDEGVSYALLVNAPSVQAPTLLRVNPGDPDSSYLIQKLEGTAAVGGRMPLGGPALSAETIASIRQWILEGAQAPAQSLMPTSVRAAWPMSNGRARDLSAIVIALDAPIDTTVLEAGTVELWRSGNDGRFDDGNEVRIEPRIEVRSLAPTVLAIQSEEGWPADRYELRISASAPLAVTDLNAMPIDGDIDGIPGGDFVLRFDVE